MSYQKERDLFIAAVTRYGLPLWAAERLLREATGIHRRAELACSSEAADRDRVPCPAMLIIDNKGYTRPGPGPCLCDDYPVGDHAKGIHHKIPRITLQNWRAEERCRKALAEVNAQLTSGPAPPSLYQRFTAAGIEIDSHFSDLYVPFTDQTRAIVAEHEAVIGRRVNRSTFKSSIDGTIWYDFPFQFDPFWEAVAGKAEKANG